MAGPTRYAKAKGAVPRARRARAARAAKAAKAPKFAAASASGAHKKHSDALAKAAASKKKATPTVAPKAKAVPKKAREKKRTHRPGLAEEAGRHLFGAAKTQKRVKTRSAGRRPGLEAEMAKILKEF